MKIILERNNNKETFSILSNNRLQDSCEVEGWMLDVVNTQQLDERVFYLSRAYLQRFLSLTNVNQNQLQLLAAACLLLGSKVSSGGLKIKQLLEYTDNIILQNELLDMEVVILSSLCWDLHLDIDEERSINHIHSLQLSQ